VDSSSLAVAIYLIIRGHKMRILFLLLLAICFPANGYEIYQGPNNKFSDTQVIVDTAGVPVSPATPFPSYGYHRDFTSGLPVKNDGHDGILHTVDYLDAIGLGKVAGHTGFRGFGQRSALSTSVTGDDIWSGVAVLIPIPNQTTGDSLTVVSTSAADTGAGANVRKIDIHYLDVAGVEQHMVVTLNGVTPVTPGLTGVRHVQYVHAEEVGAYGATAGGTITVYRTGDAARIYAQLSPGTNVSLNSQRMVPAGKSFYMKYIVVSGASGKPLSVRLRATSDFEGILTPNIFIYSEVFFIQDSAVFMNLDVPRVFPAFSIIKATAYSPQLGGDVSISYGGFLE